MNNILIYICVAIVLIALLAMAAEIRRELHFFKVTRYHVTSRKLSGLSGPLTILFLSDLHNWKYGEHNERLLSAIENEHPDLILIGGDMLVGKKETPCDICPGSRPGKLPSLCPVYYANGNHEQRMKEETEIYGNVYEVYKRKLDESGVIFLENASQRIKIKDTDISISGTGTSLFCLYEVSESSDYGTNHICNARGTGRLLYSSSCPQSGLYGRIS